jgi:hypothetical protein
MKILNELGMTEIVFFKGGGGGGSTSMAATDERNAWFWDNIVKPNLSRTQTISQTLPDYSLRQPAKYSEVQDKITTFENYDPMTIFSQTRETFGTALRSYPLYSRVIELYDEWRESESPDDPYIAIATNEHATTLRENIELGVIPKFETGMRDVGAVLSVGFHIGRALIWRDYDNEVAKFDAELRAKAYSEHKARLQDMAKVLSNSIGNLYASFEIEQNKNALQICLAFLEKKKVVASMRHNLVNDENMAFAKYDTMYTSIMHDRALWPFEPLQALAQVHSAMHGGVGASGQTKTNAAAATISGALGGAAVGANPGIAAATGGWSIPVGAALGGLSGYLGSK